MRLKCALSALLLLVQNTVAQKPPVPGEFGTNPDSEFIFLDQSSNQLHIQARIFDAQGNEFPVVFVLDTGMSNSWLDSTLVTKLNLKFVEKTTITSESGKSPGEIVLLPKLQVGSLEVRNLKVITKQPSSDLLSVKLEIKGFMGADVLRGKILTLDFPDHRVAFTTQPPTLQGYKKLLDEPIKLNRGLPFVGCKLPDNKNTSDCNLLLDTGNTESLIFCDEMSKFIHLKKIDRTDAITSGIGVTPVVFGPLDWIGIGDSFRINGVEVGLYKGVTKFQFQSKYCPGNLGVPLIDRYVVQIDYAKKRVRFFQKQ